MNYIKKVILKNFQSHKNTEINFTQGLNTIIGESDSGKTAILRGIKWVLYNEPLGDYFIREGSTECSVKLFLSNEVVVERLRTKSKNQYILTNSSGEIDIFEGFGVSVPKEIIDQTGIKKVNLDKDQSRTLNLAEQLEGAFLLSEKPALKASSIGRLVGANIIDDALRVSLKDINNYSRDKSKLLVEADLLNKKLDDFKYLSDLNSKVEKLDKIITNIEEDTVKKERLEKLLIEYKSYIRWMKHLTRQVENLQKVDRVKKLYSILKQEISEYFSLVKLKENKENIKKNINLNYNTLVELSPFLDIRKKYSYLKQKIDKVVFLKSIESKYEAIQLDIKRTQEIQKKYSQKTDFKNELIDLENSIDKYYYLNNLKLDLSKAQSSLDIGNNYIINFDNIDDIEKIINNLENQINKLLNIEMLKKKLESIEKEVKYEHINIKKINIENQENLKKYKEALENEKTCPICLNNLDEKHINNVIKIYMEGL